MQGRRLLRVGQLVLVTIALVITLAGSGLVISGSRSIQLGPALLGIVIAGGIVGAFAGALVVLREQRFDRALRSRPQRDQLTEATASPKASEVELVWSLLQSMTAEIAAELKADPELVRAAVFEPTAGDKLRIIPSFHFNMTLETELGIEIPIGQGAVGFAFARNQPVVAVAAETGNLPIEDKSASELVHPDLKWVIAVPVGSVEAPVLALTVDGLRLSRTLEQLEPCVPKVMYWGVLLGGIINAELIESTRQRVTS
jgi:hypothetical protein